ncbi:MAG: DedA family protein [Bdellovibrionales bacterium]|nr:DedA family protein [Bdellovibrionales bacterium]
MLDHILAAFDGNIMALWGPFMLLLLCGFGLPLPEDVVLVAAGFLAAQYGHSFWITAALMYLGIMGGDLTIYAAGRVLGKKFLDTKLGRLMIAPEKLPRIKGLYTKYGSGVVFVGRFLPGFRTPIFFTSGSLHFPFYKFLAFDGFAALVSAPLFVWLGHLAGERFAEDSDELYKMLGTAKTILIPVALLAGLGIFFYIRSKAKKENAS